MTKTVREAFDEWVRSTPPITGEWNFKVGPYLFKGVKQIPEPDQQADPVSTFEITYGKETPT